MRVESEEETSPNTLVDSETESYPCLPDSAVPLDLLATLSISSSIAKGLGGYGRSKSKSRGGLSVGGGDGGDGVSTRTAGVEKQEPDEDDDVVRIFCCCWINCGMFIDGWDFTGCRERYVFHAGAVAGLGA